MIKFFNGLRAWHKSLIAMAYDLVMIVSCFYLALSLRLDSFLPLELMNLSISSSLLFLMVFSKFGIFLWFKFYKGIWRYSSTYDLFRLIRGISVGIVVSYALMFIFFRLENIPRSAILIEWCLLIIALGGGRFSYRLLRDHLLFKVSDDTKNVLIIGAGDAGEQVYREIRRDQKLDLLVVGFIDDDPAKKNKTIHGIQVLGSNEDIPNIVRDYGINQIIVAIPSASSNDIKKILEVCEPLQLDLKILPKTSDIINGKIEYSQLRNVSLEDLIGRKQVYLDSKSVEEMISNKIVLVTGAGGSIGSELVVQMLKFNPQRLVLIDFSEFNLFELESKVRAINKNVPIELIIADIRSKKELTNVFSKVKPEIVFHAAAYKHVPMMEMNPLQSVKTNILGTKNIAELSLLFEVEKFVLVSTDKAINPTNIMGATKRIAEIVCEYHQSKSLITKFLIVRFGNVIGSSGSVVPIFKKQIEAGGPVTVTHPEIRRYFMSIPEASQLILQAGAIGKGGEIFVLDMGEPIKIVDLAKQLLKLANLEEGKDIEIKYIGLRPGEKLFEEVLADQEKTMPTVHPLLRIAKTRGLTSNTWEQVLKMEEYFETEGFKIKEALLALVPEYDPEQLQNAQFDSKISGLNSNSIH